MTYQEALDYIASLAPRGWRLGLDRMGAFCEAAGLSETLRSINYVHIAGTNGKGSTTAFTQSLLVEAGKRTGAFFSPYVVDPRERVQFGRSMIGKEELAEVTEALIPIAEQFTETEFGGITEFEFKTAVGFEYWRRKKCDWVALEVGLGGRYDATNVVTPAVSVITSIGLDHVAILGSTLAAIAREKAGIIKPGVPVVVGILPPEAMEVVEEVAADCGSQIWRYGREVLWERSGTVVTPAGHYDGLVPGLKGDIQRHNLALAIAALDAARVRLDPEPARLGASRAFAPGRFQVVEALGTTFVFDGAHNTEAARNLTEVFQSDFCFFGARIVTNMVRGHELDDFYREILPIIQTAHVVPIGVPRAYPVEETLSAIRQLGKSAQGHETLEEGLKAAALEAGPDELVLVTGSYYLVGEALRLLLP
ncbi:bifunctional folylpolyglutamate synthase/dihydrofolate synthase [Fimbriimonas ginsengisoli]|uniref:tetrahydrofolate synthase n=1 Tax=Fimbriimonas ginsengisoli Gsoil 348 TaxID=661478 RepID=A0A068NV19_FIMGI|nr:folylpolyglutamate synthase/dihydrofolate synthase family protein [Fimbriimonas ginsengisoli]AIE87388.1 FolC bifunctional protein [Fimbriimonas ginsengisoli Gsoil 348]